MAQLKKDYLVLKKNVLNEIRANDMTLQELRFFSIYLSKINARDVNTRVVRFPMADFQAIMELGRIDINYMKRVTDSLLCKVVHVPDERGGYSAFQLFKRCKVSRDEQNEWFVEIDAHDDALPLMFEFKERYFSYQLWNALRLRSSNQLRMYEILKQYEHVGYRILTIDGLKELLGIGKDEYPRYDNFKAKVLDACQRALTESTDIKFTYEPYGKRGRGGKALFLKFTIEKNTDFVDQITLFEFIEEHKQPSIHDVNDDSGDGIGPGFRSRIELFMDALNGEFAFEDVVTLNDKLREYLSSKQFSDEIFCFHYLNDRYNEMRRHSMKSKIKNRFGYVRSLIGTEI